MTRVSAPIFQFGNQNTLKQEDSYTRPEAIGGQLSLSGPSVEVEKGHLPVRGDLAHIRLAGRFFVPHYAVPMPHRVTANAVRLHKAANAEAEAVETVAKGATFNVLDIAGGWAWGQVGEDGFVGYVPMNALEAQ